MKTRTLLPLRYVALLAFLMPSPVFTAETVKVERAVEFLKAACVAKGERTEITATGKAGITIKNWKGAGVQGEVSFSNEEIEGLAVALNEATAHQATEIRECMKPYIDRILTIILGSGEPTSDADSVKIVRVTCANPNMGSAYVHILLSSRSRGIRSFVLFPTWGGGGEITEDFSQPLPKRVEKALLFRPLTPDPVARNHQFGLKATFGVHSTVEKFAGPENTFEPGGRCPRA